MNAFDYPAIGQRIKSLRKVRKLGQVQVAELLGKSLRTIQKYESGEIEVSIDVVNALAKILDTTPAYLLGYDVPDADMRNLSDVLNFLFELDRIANLKFDIEVKRPPKSDRWTCSIVFDGKAKDADSNADMCLFLEDWAERREEVRTFATSSASLHKWQDQTLAYYAGTSLKKEEVYEMSEEERITRHNAYLESQYGKKEETT